MGYFIECKTGTRQYHGECISYERYTNIISDKSLLSGFSLGISTAAILMSVICFIVFKIGKSKKRIFFKLSILGLITFIISMACYKIIGDPLL